MLLRLQELEESYLKRRWLSIAAGPSIASEYEDQNVNRRDND